MGMVMVTGRLWVRSRDVMLNAGLIVSESQQCKILNVLGLLFCLTHTSYSARKMMVSFQFKYSFRDPLNPNIHHGNSV